MAGLYFEDFEVGRVFQHAMTRTVTEMDNTLFSLMTMNPQPLHLDEEFSKKTMFKQRIVNSLFTLGLVIGVTVADTTLGTTLGNLGMTDIRFIYAEGLALGPEAQARALAEARAEIARLAAEAAAR